MQGFLKFLQRDLGVRLSLLGRKSRDCSARLSFVEDDLDVVFLADFLRGFPSDGCEILRTLVDGCGVKQRVMVPGLASVASES